MNYSVRLAESAENDVADIGLYIAEQSGVVTAERILDGLDACWTKLSSLPHRGNVPKELAAAGRANYRELHYKPYRIIYRVENREVTVYAVVDGRRNMEDFLRRRLSQFD